MCSGPGQGSSAALTWPATPLPAKLPTRTSEAARRWSEAVRRDDGSNQARGYVDTTGYEPVNDGPGAMRDIARWTPENLPIGPEDGVAEQAFLTPHRGGVDGFVLPLGPDGRTDHATLGVPPPQALFAPGQGRAPRWTSPPGR